MRLRYIVPTLGIAVLSTLTANAAESGASGLKFSGWVDTVFAASDTDVDDAAGTAKDEGKVTLGFDAIANLKSTWAVSKEVTAKVNLWFWPDYNDLQTRDAYLAYAVNDEFTVRAGKFINPIGWIATDPAEKTMWRVRTSTIGYTSIYGNDVIGAAVSYDPKGSMVSGSFAITNGYFTSSDATNRDALQFNPTTAPSGGSSANRENDALGFGVDLRIDPSKELAINVDLAYDIGSDGSLGNTVGAGEIGGDVFLIGANAEYQVNEQLSVAGEVMSISAGDSDAAGGGSVDNSGFSRTQGLIAAKYTLSGTSFPMALSAMGQLIQSTTESAGGDVDTDSSEFAVALLTNPITSSNFGLNYELSMFKVDNDAPTDDVNGWAFSVEGLVTY